jgi:hypothetical protein
MYYLVYDSNCGSPRPSVFVEDPPPAATNLDCGHRTPLTICGDYFIEDRIVDGWRGVDAADRYYQFEMPFDGYVELNFVSDFFRAGTATAEIRSDCASTSTPIFTMALDSVDGRAQSTPTLAAGNYTLRVSHIENGTRYLIRVRPTPMPCGQLGQPCCDPRGLRVCVAGACGADGVCS